MSEHRLYTGSELLALKPEDRKPLIDNIIWNKEKVILIGDAGIGKSILTQQMCFALSTGEPFLSEYTTNECSTLIVQAEGELGETRMRVKNMLEGASWKADNFNLIFYPGLALDTDKGCHILVTIIDNKVKEGMPPPKIIVLDPLYMMMQGDICNQKDVTAFCKNMRLITARYQCALLILHHKHRQRRTPTGIPIQEGADSIFGSFAWKAFVDRLYDFSALKGGVRRLSADKKRAGGGIDSIDLTFIEPTPLLFEIKGDISPFIRAVELNLSVDEAKSPQDICEITKLPYNSVKKALTELRKAGKIEKRTSGYPVKWVLKEEEKG